VFSQAAVFSARPHHEKETWPIGRPGLPQARDAFVYLTLTASHWFALVNQYVTAARIQFGGFSMDKSWFDKSSKKAID